MICNLYDLIFLCMGLLILRVYGDARVMLILAEQSFFSLSPSMLPISLDASILSCFLACLQFNGCDPCVSSQIGFNCSWCSKLQR